jgi:ubiquitin carboxyl-terminal hydrolase 26/29/37
VPGFKNRGNTCFLAATAQVLCGLSAFAGDLVALPDASSPGALGFGSAFEGAAGADARGAPSPGSRGGVASALRALVHAREDHASLFDNPQTRALATASLDPSQLKEAIQSWHEQYKGYEQHDAHEFLGHTFEALSQEVAGNGVSSARSPTCRFEGAFTTTFRCEECETYACSSTEPEWFRWLSLDLPDSDTGSAEPLELEGLIARYFAPEIVEKLCERDGCGGTHAEMARQLTCAPEALFVHLKRYRAEREGVKPALRQGLAGGRASDDRHARAARRRLRRRGPRFSGGRGGGVDARVRRRRFRGGRGGAFAARVVPARGGCLALRGSHEWRSLRRERARGCRRRNHGEVLDVFQ